MDATGYADWMIEDRQNASAAKCVAVGVMSATHSVLVMPATGAAVGAALEAVRRELLDRCLGRSDAIELVRSALVAAGETNFNVAADPWGPQAAPINEMARYQAHVAAECTVLVSGLGRDESGKATYYLWRNWP
jgi:hypothetical protein